MSPPAEAFRSHLTFTIKAPRCCVAAREDERRVERFRQLDRTQGLSLEKCSGGGKEGRRWAHSSALYLPLTQINPVTAREPHCLWRSFYSFNPLCLSHVEVLNVPLLFSRGVELLPFTMRHTLRPSSVYFHLEFLYFHSHTCPCFISFSADISFVPVPLKSFWHNQSTFWILASGSEQVAEGWNESGLRSVYSINLTVVLLFFLVANGCCGKQCSQGQIRAEGSSFLLQTHAHRLQVSTFVSRRAQNHQWWCAECHHLPCLLSDIAS